MHRWNYYLLTGCVSLGLSLATQAQETNFGPLVRWGAELRKTEPTGNDTLKKMTADLSDFKTRLQFWEEHLAKHHSSMTSQLQAMQDSLKGMHANCERMQNELTAMKSGHNVNQAGYTVPRKPVEDGSTKVETATQELLNRQVEEMTATRKDMLNLLQQVQLNTRELTDLKKKYDALQLEFIQAQNDIGKLQQDLVKVSPRTETSRLQPEASPDRARQSMALPLPPDSQPNVAKTTQGILKFVNQYPLSLTVVVDGQFYTLRSGDSLSLNRNPGYVTYEVVGIQGNTLRTINAAETLSVQIVPR